MMKYFALLHVLLCAASVVTALTAEEEKKQCPCEIKSRPDLFKKAETARYEFDSFGRPTFPRGCTRCVSLAPNIGVVSFISQNTDGWPTH